MSARVWVGGPTASWGDARGWRGGKLPGPDDHVLIAAPVNVEGPIAVVIGALTSTSNWRRTLWRLRFRALDDWLWRGLSGGT